eukprot:CAMPEP_0174257352 /NCGR_PEP_ID=MMETSP0439-20130205/6501_1 /TAXON_ID=0 /ORGANISM="Stereomyxa ramosa, Strain Chinc5" /LENGTH=363 /DNA_ID=CAMNT_0015340405 /DNA_START=1025 /DNA_END=2113 /DNA_ORIENTATION=-
MNPGFKNVLPPHEFLSLKKSLEAIYERGEKGRAYDMAVARSFLDFFQSVFSGYQSYFKDNKFQQKEFLESRPEDILEFLREFEASQMWACFIQERESMAVAHQLAECPLLRRQTNSSSQVIQDKPAVFLVCSQCGADVDSDELEDKERRPLCFGCYEEYQKDGKLGVGWLKSLMDKNEQRPEGERGRFKQKYKAIFEERKRGKREGRKKKGLAGDSVVLSAPSLIKSSKPQEPNSPMAKSLDTTPSLLKKSSPPSSGGGRGVASLAAKFQQTDDSQVRYRNKPLHSLGGKPNSHSAIVQRNGRNELQPNVGFSAHDRGHSEPELSTFSVKAKFCSGCGTLFEQPPNPNGKNQEMMINAMNGVW